MGHNGHTSNVLMKIHTVVSYSTKNQDIKKHLPRIHLYFNSNHHTDKKTDYVLESSVQF